MMNLAGDLLYRCYVDTYVYVSWIIFRVHTDSKCIRYKYNGAELSVFTLDEWTKIQDRVAT